MTALPGCADVLNVGWWNASAEDLTAIREQLLNPDGQSNVETTVPVLSENWRAASKKEIDNAVEQIERQIVSTGGTVPGEGGTKPEPTSTPFGWSAFDQVPDKPDTFSYVYDYTSSLFSDSDKAVFTQLGRNLASIKGGQAIAMVVDSMNGVDGLTYVSAVINKWGIGDAERKDGVLLLLSLKDSSIFIGTGSGIDTVLTDEKAGEMIDNNLHFFSDGQFAKGMMSIYRDICIFLANYQVNTLFPEIR